MSDPKAVRGETTSKGAHGGRVLVADDEEKRPGAVWPPSCAARVRGRSGGRRRGGSRARRGDRADVLVTDLHMRVWTGSSSSTRARSGSGAHGHSSSPPSPTSIPPSSHGRAGPSTTDEADPIDELLSSSTALLERRQLRHEATELRAPAHGAPQLPTASSARAGDARRSQRHRAGCPVEGERLHHGESGTARSWSPRRSTRQPAGQGAVREAPLAPRWRRRSSRASCSA